jgi:hypothetical protein
MIRKFAGYIKKRAIAREKSLKTGFIAVHHSLFAPGPSVILLPVFMIPPDMENALNAGKLYRLTSSHAPIFSLYTFFGDR